MKKHVWWVLISGFLLCNVGNGFAASYSEVYSGSRCHEIDVYQNKSATFSFDLVGSDGEAVWNDYYGFKHILDPSMDATGFVIGETITSASLSFQFSSVDNPKEVVTIETGISDGGIALATETYYLGIDRWFRCDVRQYADLTIDLMDYVSYLNDGAFEAIVLALDIKGYCPDNDFRIEFARLDVTTEVAPVPEPATLLLLGSGLLGVAGLRRKRDKLNA